MVRAQALDELGFDQLNGGTCNQRATHMKVAGSTRPAAVAQITRDLTTAGAVLAVTGSAGLVARASGMGVLTAFATMLASAGNVYNGVELSGSETFHSKRTSGLIQLFREERRPRKGTSRFEAGGRGRDECSTLPRHRRVSCLSVQKPSKCCGRYRLGRRDGENACDAQCDGSSGGRGKCIRHQSCPRALI